MKNFRIALFVSVALLFTFFSCNEDNQHSVPSLQAKWELQKIGRIMEDGSEELSNFVNPSGCDKNNFELLEDGTTKCLSFNKNEDDECVEAVVAGTWSKGDGTFTMVFPGPYQRVYEVLELTNSMLKIKFLEDSPESPKEEDDDNLWVYSKM